MVTGATLNATGTHFGFVSQSTADPPEAFISATASVAPVQVSHAQTVPEVALGRSEVVRWTSDDGMAVEGLLSYPMGYREGDPVPLLVVVHGGPTGVFTQSFIGSSGSYPIAAFTRRGYAVLRANPRGSSGYGKDFRYANYGDWGGGDYRDIMTGVDAMIERGVADPDRLGVMGWSYGGYMTSWIITQTDRFKAASVGAGLPNLMSFSGTADVPDFVVDYFGGEFWEEPDAWQERSALFNIEGVTTPTLIQHGEQDRRVPISQAYELRNALSRQDVDVTMVVYPRQPHGIQEPKLLLDAMHRNLSWFDRWVLGRTPGGRLIGQDPLRQLRWSLARHQTRWDAPQQGGQVWASPSDWLPVRVSLAQR
jgi:dipeptidyl aminopeptidase/acylaminoacyl peptidase